MSDKNIKLKNVKTGDYLFPKTKVGNVEGLTPIYLSDGTSASATVNADTLNGKTDSFFQQQLVSGTNIKTINNSSILGAGNFDIQDKNGADWNNIIASYTNVGDITYTATENCVVYTGFDAINIWIDDVYVTGDNDSSVMKSAVCGSGPWYLSTGQKIRAKWNNNNLKVVVVGVK